MNFEEFEDIVVNLIALHDGGELVGRARLQWEAYLLHRSGANFDLPDPFTYHDYGPYSGALVYGLLDARANDRIEIEEALGRYAIRYEIFRLKGDRDGHGDLGDLPAGHARPLVRELQEVSDLVLELAAAIVFLREEWGYGPDAEAETAVRKPLKATEERMGKALDLLSKLGLRREAGAVTA